MIVNSSSTFSITLLLVAVVGVCLLGSDAAISETCLTETQALESNAPLQEEYGKLLESVKTKADDNDECNADSLTDYNCTISFKGDGALYTELCTNASGQIYQDSLQLDCSGFFGLADLEIIIHDIPVCVGTSCDLSELEHDDLNGTIAEFELLKDNIRGDGCSVDSGSGHASGRSLAAISALALALLFSFA